MKQIQKGFTLIELMIVVAIIGILAAVAIPAYQDYVVKAKLSKVQSTLDPIKLALSLYYQEQGAFPQAISTTQGPTAGSGLGIGTMWNSLGFNAYPSIPNEVSDLTVDGSTGAGVAAVIKVTLKNIKAGSFDQKVLAIVGQAGSTAVTWTCSVQSGTTITDTIGLKYFDTINQTCLP